MSPLITQAMPAFMGDSLLSYPEIRNEKSGHLNLLSVKDPIGSCSPLASSFAFLQWYTVAYSLKRGLVEPGALDIALDFPGIFPLPLAPPLWSINLLYGS